MCAHVDHLLPRFLFFFLLQTIHQRVMQPCEREHSVLRSGLNSERMASFLEWAQSGHDLKKGSLNRWMVLSSLAFSNRAASVPVFFSVFWYFFYFFFIEQKSRRCSCSSPGNPVASSSKAQTKRETSSERESERASVRIGPFPGCKVEQMAGK